MESFGQSVWEKALLQPLKTSPVGMEEDTDLAIIGGGFLGLSSALHAARRGLSVRLVEAGSIASGASGKNGGQVIPGLKYDPDWLIHHFGKGRGERIVEFAEKTADFVFDLISNEDLNVSHRRNGWIFAAHTDKAMKLAASRNRQWLARGADVRLLDGHEISAITGGKGYIGGWLDRRAGVIDPLAFARELARIATDAGARLAENEKVVSVEPASDRFRLETQSGKTIVARKVIVATNGYADGLVPGLAQSLVALHSFQIATEVLNADQSASILPQGQAVSDSRRILVYYRKTPDGRLMLGGRGKMGEPAGPHNWAHLESAMLRLFPDLRGIRITHRWHGRIAMTPDHLPHVHEILPGMLTALGCQGRGVGLMTALGPRLVDALIEDGSEAIPFLKTPITEIPFHRFRKLGVAAMITIYRSLDALER